LLQVLTIVVHTDIYICGGSRISTIDRFQFPFDSGTTNQVGNLSEDRNRLCANNSSTRGYVYGGWNSGYSSHNDLSIIDRFLFPFDSGTAKHIGNLSENKSRLCANNSSTHGYVCGSGSCNSTIDRFQFPFDDGTANYVGNLSGSRGWLSANNSSTYGYVCGGIDSSYYPSSTIDRFQFPFDSGTANQVGNLSGRRAFLSANNSSIHGYVCSGWNKSDNLSTIDRFQFPFDSGTTNQVGNLSGSRSDLSAIDGVDFATMFV